MLYREIIAVCADIYDRVVGITNVYKTGQSGNRILADPSGRAV
jgi:hypothetical protein